MVDLNNINPYRGAWRRAGALLLPFGALYAAGIRLRSLAYRRGWLKSFPAGVPVISVGNITAGGTGKTPMVQLLAGWLHDEGLGPAVLSRGYGGKRSGEDVLVLEAGSDPNPRQAGDEPCLLARNLPGVPVLVSPDRVASAKLAVSRLGAGLLVLDDGFQHLRLRRDLNLLLVDASEPLWKNRVIPAGTLREPLSAMGRADVVICTRTPDSGIPPDLEQLINRYCPGRPRFIARHAPTGVTPLGSTPLPRAREDSAGFLLVSGIGNPQSFRNTAEACGLRVAGEKHFADHHRFQPSDLDQVGRLLAELGADAVLFTEKDAVRLGPLAGRLKWPAGYLGIRMIVENEDQLKRLVLHRIRKAR